MDTPDPRFCGCDPERRPDALTADMAVACVLRLIQSTLRTETLPLGLAVGRVLAEAVQARQAPSQRFAAADGYALSTERLRGGGPWLLPVMRSGWSLASGAVLRVRRGQRLPPGLDAVTPLASADERRGMVFLAGKPDAVANAGVDRQAEESGVAGVGAELGPREIAAIGSEGVAQVAVRRRLRVSLLTARLGAGSARAATAATARATIKAALSRPWAEVQDLGLAPADSTGRTACIAAARWADLVVFVGGVDNDEAPAFVREAGGDINCLRLAVDPCDRLGLGRLGNALCLVLPEDPVSALAAWRLIGRLAAERMAGLADRARSKIVVKATDEVIRQSGPCELRPARLVGYDAAGAPLARLHDHAESMSPASLPAADGFAIIPGEEERVRPGQLLEFLAL